MNLSTLFQMQKELDDYIVKTKGLEGQDLLPQKILALQVELGECANEWRGFKFWSENQSPRYEKKSVAFADPGGAYEHTSYPLLEEYVDCLHFILSIGLSIWHQPEEVGPHISNPVTITNQFIRLNEYVTTIYTDSIIEEVHGTSYLYDSYDFLLELFLGLGELLGFTWDQIESAYTAKWNINKQRQTNGY